MTRQEARSILNRAEAAINENVRNLMSRSIDYAEFGRRNRSLHEAIEAAGQRENFARRWRSAHPLRTV